MIGDYAAALAEDARREADRDEHQAQRGHVAQPGWWPTADDRDDLSAEDYS